MTRWTRRQALRGLLVGGGMTALGGTGIMRNLISAQAADPEKNVPDRYYIFCYFEGGWDILLSLDPRDPAKFNDGNMSVTRIQPAYRHLRYVPSERLNDPVFAPTQLPNMRFGPFIGDLANLASDLLIIRGISMDTLTHQVGRRRFLTGKQPSGLTARGSSTDTWLAAHLSRGEPLPNLSMRVESYNRDQPTFASAVRTDSSTDLLRLLKPGTAHLDETQDALLDELMRNQALCAPTRTSPALIAAESSRATTHNLLRQRLDEHFDFKASTTQELREHFNIDNSPNRFNPTSPRVQAAIAATAITQGLSRCVSIQAINQLDTHDSNWQSHGARQLEGLNAVSALVRYLKETPYKNNPDNSESWLDHTTVIGFSEFSRTPLLNAKGGRDHWLNNACFMLGGGIKGGRVLGKSSDFGMYPSKLNLETGELSEDGVIVRPDHILQALYEEVGLTTEPDLRVDPFRAIFG